MAVLSYDEVRIRYEEYGDPGGYPVLLFAPGGLLSRIDAWSNKGPAPYDPREVLADRFRVIAMDQRNAGESHAPVSASDGWHSFARDHVALLDYLGIERCHVLGSCIGCSMALQLMEEAPGRVSAAVLQQPIGRSASNEQRSITQLQRFVDSLRPERELDDTVVAALYERLYGAGFVFSVSREWVRGCRVPMLVLPGSDESHPREVALELAELAPDASVLEDWKSATPEIITAIRAFLEAHTPLPA